LQLTRLDFFFWAAGLIENIALFFVLFYKRRARRFPLFTSLITLNVIRTIVLYCVLHFASNQSYFLSYWSLALVDTALQFCIVYEVAGIVFRPAGVWAPDVRQRFIRMLAPSLGIALGLSCLASPPARTWMGAVVSRGNLCADILMSELFVLMLALSISAGLPWKTHVAKVAQGMGTYSLIVLITQTGQSYFGAERDAPMYILLSHIRMAAYLGCVSYWIAALWAEAEQARPMPDELREGLFALQTRLAYDLGILRSRKNGK
jgi:hypothetical protein